MLPEKDWSSLIENGSTRLDSLCHFPIPKKLPPDSWLTRTRSQSPNLVVRGRHIHSTINPEKEAQRLIEPYQNAQAGILLGYGCGYSALAWQAQALRPLLVVELAPAHLTAGRVTANLIPEQAEIYFARGLDDDFLERDLLRFLKNLPLSCLKSLAWLETNSLVSLDLSTWAVVRQKTKTIVANFLTNLFTELEFERRWFSNILSNAPLLARTQKLKTLAGSLKGQTAIIIGAGPSLDDWLDWLPEAKNHAVLIAVDTACQTLAKAGIIPDAVVSLDGQIHNLNDFLGIDTSKITLFADLSVYPAIPRLPFSRVVFFETADLDEQAGRTVVISHPLTLWCKQAIGEIGVARSGGNVGTSALEITRLLGISRILLAGFDYAWPDGLTHSRESPALQKIRNQETRSQPPLAVLRKTLANRALIQACDNRGQPVKTDIILAKYASWTAAAWKEASQEAPKPDWANLSVKGLALEGIRVLQSRQEAREFLGKTPRPSTFFEQSPPPIDSSGPLELQKRLNLLREEASKLLAISKPLPPLDQTLELFAKFPFLRRGYGAQILRVEKTEDRAWLLGEIRFQLQGVLKTIKRYGLDHPLD